MKNTNTPKRLFIYALRKGFYSVNEYVNAKQRNVVKPFRLDDETAIADLKERIELFRRTAKRDVVVATRSEDTKQLIDKLDLKIER